jgi:hypothetical protein
MPHRDCPREPDTVEHPLVTALRALAEPLGATLVCPKAIEPGDIPLSWDGKVVVGFRLTPLHGALDRLIATVERELGSPLSKLSREDKQRAVRMLDDMGAFTLRKSVEEIADSLGVSRFTVYNYLNASTVSARDS